MDGGAIFGVVPKLLWQKEYPADPDNFIRLSMNSLLIDTGERKILIDTGIGDKQDKKFQNNYIAESNDSMLNSLHIAGYDESMITDVVMTHLHFDHCGGGVKRTEDGKGYELTFPNATYIISKSQWENALKPNRKEKSSFLKENFLPIEESGQLRLINGNEELIPDLYLKVYDGHTIGQLIPFIKFNGQTYVFVADLIPTTAHLKLPWIMALDMQPLLILREKEEFLNEAVKNNYALIFQHDIKYEGIFLARTENGFEINKTFILKDVMSELATKKSETIRQ